MAERIMEDNAKYRNYIFTLQRQKYDKMYELYEEKEKDDEPVGEYREISLEDEQ